MGIKPDKKERMILNGTDKIITAIFSMIAVIISLVDFQTAVILFLLNICLILTLSN